MGRCPAHGGPVSDDVAPSEESLLLGARAADREAIERLYADHGASARRLATILAGTDAADELVSESFARVIAQLSSGGGPTTSFRAYLNTTIRNLYRDQLRRTREVPASDRPWLLDETESPIDELIEGLDANGATAALATLPESWQQVLWHSEVEGRKPAEIAELLSTNPAAVSSLVYRAREGLRRAYLDQYAGPSPIDANCKWTRARLSQYVRDDLSGRAASKVATHLGSCPACSAAQTGMAEVNTKLAAYLFPVVLIGGLQALDTAGSTGASSPLVAELTARADGTPVTEAASAAANSGSGGLGGTPTRVSVTVAAAVVALVAITATAFALTGDEGEPRSAPDDAVTTDVGSATPPVPTPTQPSTPPEVPTPTTSSAVEPTVSVVVTPGVPVPSVPGVSVPTTPGPLPPPLPPPTVPPPSDPPSTVPEPQPTSVRPVAPATARISKCGTYGSLRLPSTPGVRYALLDGDGRQGTWTVGARGAPGYVIAKGAPTSFTGDLGRYRECPVPLAIREVTTTPAGSDHWQVTVTPRMPDGERRSLAVSYWFDHDVRVARRVGDGWVCRGPAGAEVTDRTVSAGAKLTCTFAERGKQPTPVSLVVAALGGSGSPSGKVALTADGDVIDIEDFDSVDR